MTRAELLALAERVEAATGPDRELEAEIMFDLYAVPVGKASDGGPCGYLWPEDDPSWNFGIRFPGRDRAWFKQQRAGKGQETLLIERDGALVLMNSLRIPPLMSSVDAAASLMPPDYCVEVVGRDGHGWHCSAWKNVTWPPLASHPDDQSEAGAPILKINAQAKDEARARLAAALRVRATEVGE